MLNATPKSLEGMIASDKLLYSLGGGILCAKASMLLQVQPSASVYTLVHMQATRKRVPH